MYASNPNNSRAYPLPSPRIWSNGIRISSPRLHLDGCDVRKCTKSSENHQFANYRRFAVHPMSAGLTRRGRRFAQRKKPPLYHNHIVVVLVFIWMLNKKLSSLLARGSYTLCGEFVWWQYWRPCRTQKRERGKCLIASRGRRGRALGPVTALQHTLFTHYALIRTVLSLLTY